MIRAKQPSPSKNKKNQKKIRTFGTFILWPPPVGRIVTDVFTAEAVAHHSAHILIQLMASSALGPRAFPFVLALWVLRLGTRRHFIAVPVFSCLKATLPKTAHLHKASFLMPIVHLCST